MVFDQRVENARHLVDLQPLSGKGRDSPRLYLIAVLPGMVGGIALFLQSSIQNRLLCESKND